MRSLPGHFHSLEDEALHQRLRGVRPLCIHLEQVRDEGAVALDIQSVTFLQLLKRDGHAVRVIQNGAGNDGQYHVEVLRAERIRLRMHVLHIEDFVRAINRLDGSGPALPRGDALAASGDNECHAFSLLCMFLPGDLARQEHPEVRGEAEEEDAKEEGFPER